MLRFYFCNRFENIHLYYSLFLAYSIIYLFIPFYFYIISSYVSFIHSVNKHFTKIRKIISVN